MNLVAKEYIAAQDADDPGVLVLSRFAGAAHECREALLVNPYDTEAVAAAIHRALSMPPEERRSRYKTLFDTLTHNDIANWAERFISTLTRPSPSSDWPYAAINAPLRAAAE
jgi:trehalose 6-phosphate synthase